MPLHNIHFIQLTSRHISSGFDGIIEVVKTLEREGDLLALGNIYIR